MSSSSSSSFTNIPVSSGCTWPGRVAAEPTRHMTSADLIPRPCPRRAAEADGVKVFFGWREERPNLFLSSPLTFSLSKFWRGGGLAKRVPKTLTISRSVQSSTAAHGRVEGGREVESGRKGGRTGSRRSEKVFCAVATKSSKFLLKLLLHAILLRFCRRFSPLLPYFSAAPSPHFPHL